MSIVRKFITRRDKQEGALAIEFAVMAPLVIILVFAVVHFGFYLNAWQGVHAAAREGARIGSLSTTAQTLIEDRVESALVGVRLADGHETDVSPPGLCVNRSGDEIVVEVTGSVDIAIPFWGAVRLPVSGRGEFRCE